MVKYMEYIVRDLSRQGWIDNIYLHFSFSIGKEERKIFSRLDDHLTGKGIALLIYDKIL